MAKEPVERTAEMITEELTTALSTLNTVRITWASADAKEREARAESTAALNNLNAAQKRADDLLTELKFRSGGDWAAAASRKSGFVIQGSN